MRQPIAVIQIPQPLPDVTAMKMSSSGMITVTRSAAAHWRKRRNDLLQAVKKQLQPLQWPAKHPNEVYRDVTKTPYTEKDTTDESAHASYRVAFHAWNRIVQRGHAQRHTLQGILLAVAETDRRVAAELDLARRGFDIASALLRGKPVSRAARRDCDTTIVREAQRLVDEIDALGLSTDPAVVERLQALIGDLAGQHDEAVAALSALERVFPDDREKLEDVGLRSAAVHSRVINAGLSAAAQDRAEKAAYAAIGVGSVPA